MNKIIRNLLILITAVVVFTTGVGVNVVNYCCNDCKMFSVFVDKGDCCSSNDEAMHLDMTNMPCAMSHKAESQHSACADVQDAEGNHCSVSRVSIDLAKVASRPQIALPFVWVSDLPNLVQNIIPSNIEYSNGYEHINSPPGMSPRAYLSVIRVLII